MFRFAVLLVTIGYLVAIDIAGATAEGVSQRRVIVLFCGGGTATPAQCQADANRIRERLSRSAKAGFGGRDYDGVLLINADRGHDNLPVGTYSRSDIRRAKERIRKFLKTHGGAIVDVAAWSMGFVPFREAYSDFEKLGVYRIGTVVCGACSSGLLGLAHGRLPGTAKPEVFEFTGLQPERVAVLKPLDSETDENYGAVEFVSSSDTPAIKFDDVAPPFLNEAGRRTHAISSNLVRIDKKVVTVRLPLVVRSLGSDGRIKANILRGSEPRHDGVVKRMLATMPHILISGRGSRFWNAREPVRALADSLRALAADDVRALDGLCGNGWIPKECELVAEVVPSNAATANELRATPSEASSHVQRLAAPARQRIYTRVFSEPHVLVYFCGAAPPSDCNAATDRYQQQLPSFVVEGFHPTERERMISPFADVYKYDTTKVDRDIAARLQQLAAQYPDARFSFVVASRGFTAFERLYNRLPELGIANVDAVVFSQAAGKGARIPFAQSQRFDLDGLVNPKVVIVLEPPDEATAKSYNQPLFTYSGTLISVRVPVWKRPPDGSNYYYVPNDPHGAAIEAGENWLIWPLIDHVVAHSGSANALKESLENLLELKLATSRTIVRYARVLNPDNAQFESRRLANATTDDSRLRELRRLKARWDPRKAGCPSASDMVECEQIVVRASRQSIRESERLHLSYSNDDEACSSEKSDGEGESSDFCAGSADRVSVSCPDGTPPPCIGGDDGNTFVFFCPDGTPPPCAGGADSPSDNSLCADGSLPPCVSRMTGQVPWFLYVKLLPTEELELLIELEPRVPQGDVMVTK